MFSSTAEYALRAVMHLARMPGARATALEIAQETRTPPRYASKVLQQLASAGLVVAQRGPSGGFTLARSPAGLSVLDVINAVDPIERIRLCPMGVAHPGGRLCRLHQRLDDAIGAVQSVLAESTIAEMIAADQPSDGWSPPRNGPPTPRGPVAP